MESPYDVLDVEPGADEEAIERAYRRRVKQAHPDHGGTVRQFLRVEAAYEEIADVDGPVDAGAELADVGDQYREDRRERTHHDRRASSHEDRRASSHEDRRAQSGEAGGPRSHQDASRVEFLNYEVLDDHGWSIDDEHLFEKASAADLDPTDHGRILVRSNESLLQAAEERGFTWPFACRGGACANCAVAVADGELSMPVDHILPAEMDDRGIQLSCVGRPCTDEMQVVYNVKHLPDLDELRLPPRPFKQAYPGD